MQVRYLTDGATGYVDATAITDWTTVSSVRVTLTFESYEAGVTTDTTGERRLSTTTTNTIALRNRMP